MSITEKISEQMNRPFNSFECSAIRKISFSKQKGSKDFNIQVTFVYNRSQELLTLLFIRVREFSFIRHDKGVFNLYSRPRKTACNPIFLGSNERLEVVEIATFLVKSMVKRQKTLHFLAKLSLKHTVTVLT